MVPRVVPPWSCGEQSCPSVFSLGHQVATRREPPAEGQMLAVGVMDVGKAAAAVAGDHHPGAHARPRAHTRRC